MAIEAFRSDEPDDLDSDAGGWGVCECVIVKLNFELYKSWIVCIKRVQISMNHYWMSWNLNQGTLCRELNICSG